MYRKHSSRKVIQMPKDDAKSSVNKGTTWTNHTRWGNIKQTWKSVRSLSNRNSGSAY